jgi:hypothetical protein
MAMIPYMQTISGKISGLLAKYYIKTVHRPVEKSHNMLSSVKDNLECNVPGFYRIPCECCKVYIDQTGRTITARCKVHERHIRLHQPEKSVVAEHCI